jgi:hypothetical protein
MTLFRKPLAIEWARGSIVVMAVFYDSEGIGLETL